MREFIWRRYVCLLKWIDLVDFIFLSLILYFVLFYFDVLFAVGGTVTGRPFTTILLPHDRLWTSRPLGLHQGQPASAILNCLLAHQLCAEDPSCKSIETVIQHICGSETGIDISLVFFQSFFFLWYYFLITIRMASQYLWYQTAFFLSFLDFLFWRWLYFYLKTKLATSRAGEKERQLFLNSIVEAFGWLMRFLVVGEDL